MCVVLSFLLFWRGSSVEWKMNTLKLFLSHSEPLLDVAYIQINHGKPIDTTCKLKDFMNVSWIPNHPKQ